VTLDPTAWRPRSAPLQPQAVLAEGDAAKALVRRLQERSDEGLVRLRGVRTSSLPLALLLVGEPEDLPWADGVVYLGRDEAAPSLFVPSLLEPTFPIALLERALLARFARLAAPLAIAPGARPRVFPIGSARPLLRRNLALALR
jgi:hypothetical protein